ncbi:hypothetical protein [Acinetobacter phage Ab65]|nr:hypothetical protein [Acinetobacter phage Ab31]WMC00540.1 hypothetical protein [Acinetobacter phage Ab59]WMC00615.1 hypothetical protein [Acinetobacter phage Ab65]
MTGFLLCKRITKLKKNKTEWVIFGLSRKL